MAEFQSCFHLRRDFVRCENRQWPPVPDRRGPLDRSASELAYFGVNSAKIVVLKPREVELSEIPRVVHVLENQIDILGSAQT